MNLKESIVLIKNEIKTIQKKKRFKKPCKNNSGYKNTSVFNY